MFRNLTQVAFFIRKGLDKYRHFSKKNQLHVFILVSLVIILFSFKATSGQGQITILSQALGGYIEETSILIRQDNRPSEADLFLVQASSFENEENQDLPKNLFHEALMPYQTLASIFDFDNETRNQVVKYTVLPGDTLSQIAKDFGVSASSLVWANDLKDGDSIQPGMELKIPPVSGVIHVVKEGDTVESIAKKYSATPDKIIEFNKLPKDGTLAAGQELVVPEGKINIAGQFVAFSSKTRFANLPDLGSFFTWPTQGFNWGIIHGRNGVDIANLCGTAVYAAAEGSVLAAIESGWNGGAGKYIKLTHNEGVDTLYAHLSKILVGMGQYVAKGQLIGLMGSTGRSTGCHLHFEVHGARNPLARY